MAARENGAEKPRPGPKPDHRQHVTFKVEQSVYDVLASLQPMTGQTPDQIAQLLLHLLVTDPNSAAQRLKALVGSPIREEIERPSLIPRTNTKQVS